MKAAELHSMKTEELKVEEQRLRRQLYDVRAQAVTEKLENPRQITNIRRDIARVLTELTARSKQEAKS